MERRSFFKTLGAGLAGLALLKPDFSQAEEIQESIPVTENLFPTNIKCGLYYKDILLVNGKSIEEHSFERGVELIQYGDNGDRLAVAYPKKESAILYGDIIVDIQQLHRIFLEDTPCKLVITQNEMQITADVIIMKFGLINNKYDWCKLELAFVSEATITQL